MEKNKKKHLRKEERFCIEKMCRARDSLPKIARTLGRGVSTISEEIQRNGGRDVYSAQNADHRAYLRQYRKKKGCNKVALDGPLSRYVEHSLQRGQSPETISARLKEEGRYAYASGKSIRKFIRHRPSLERYLFWNRHDRKSGRKSNTIFLSDPGRKSIDMRPQEATYAYGHWEGDFIVSRHTTSVLLVLVERYTKMVRMALLPDRQNDRVNGALCSLLSGYTVKSLTLDNDIAFTLWRDLEEQLHAPIYFCHPYHSWEKGLVENTNRWIRCFVPKRTNIALLGESDVLWISDWMNHTPRQCLGGRTAYEMMMKEEFGQSVRSLAINLPTFRIWG
jgi:IS30 family transposase